MSLNTFALGQKIKAIRKNKGLTQQALSELVDCSPTYVSYIENGQKAMSLETLVNIANALEVSTDVLLVDSLDTVFFSSNIVANYEMADCTHSERRILNEILLSCKQILRRNRKYR